MDSMKREDIVQNYIWHIIDNMSTKDLERLVWEQLEENLSKYSDEELMTEVEEYYPELLEDVTP